ncbi:MAG TPA: hypothetical protein VLE74_04035 [Candidatus Saccharimonadales bacterium]|nr:hypothetical protein [Candidatus Saccharimonadales bacterium]
MSVELKIPDSGLITISDSRIHEIVDSALPHYNGDGTMLFHGPDHPVAVTNSFLSDWVICAEHDYVTDIEAGVGATAHHDDEYHLHLDGTRYKTKEERSAAIAERDLSHFSFTEGQLGLTTGAILATRAGATCSNLLEKQVVRADLGNTGLAYRKFLQFFMRFAKEQRNLTGLFTPFNEVKDIQIDILGVYFSQDLRYPFETVCPLTLKGLANLARLKRDDEVTVSSLAGEEFKAA